MEWLDWDCPCLGFNVRSHTQIKRRKCRLIRNNGDVSVQIGDAVYTVESLYSSHARIILNWASQLPPLGSLSTHSNLKAWRSAHYHVCRSFSLSLACETELTFLLSKPVIVQRCRSHTFWLQTVILSLCLCMEGLLSMHSPSKASRFTFIQIDTFTEENSLQSSNNAKLWLS